MNLTKGLMDELMVHPGEPAQLSKRSTKGTKVNWLHGIGGTEARDVAKRDLADLRSELSKAQDLLYANASWSVLIVLQGLDAAGKDGTIKHVMAGANPQGSDVVSFKQPSDEELRHDYLWRTSKALPLRGRIGIFNRSHYEEVLICRVHPDLLAQEHLPSQDYGQSFWEARYEDINAFERHLVRNGTRILKFFLHISRDEQRRRFLERLDDPRKQWKFSPADIAERPFFEEYQRAYEAAITATSTSWAPWYIVPADHKYALRALVGAFVVDAIDKLHLEYPKVSDEKRAEIEQAREQLLSEGA